MMTQEEVTQLINTAYDGIEKSKLGAIFVYPKGDFSNKQVNQVAFAMLPNVLNNVFAEHIHLHKEGDEWKQK